MPFGREYAQPYVLFNFKALVLCKLVLVLRSDVKEADKTPYSFSKKKTSLRNLNLKIWCHENHAVNTKKKHCVTCFIKDRGKRVMKISEQPPGVEPFMGIRYRDS